MSDEEEIVFRGNALYSHLIDQGYTDFETYKPNSLENEGYANDDVKNKMYSTPITDGPKYSNDQTIILSSHDSNILKNILSCQLLFKEDADLIEAFTSSVYVKEKKTNLYYYFGAVLAGVFSTVVTFKKGLAIWLPAGVTLLTTLYSSLNFVKEYQEIQNYNLLQTHVLKLQEMCSSIHRLLRFLKETEILSTNQVSIHNVGAAMYMPTQIREMKDLAILPSWKTIPHVRKYLMGGLLEIINQLSLSCESLRQLSPSWLSESDQMSLRESLVSNGVLSRSDQALTIKNLQLVNEIYLVVQSEYLRRIALNLSPMIWGSSKVLKDRAKKKTLDIILDVQSKVSDISFKLNVYNSIHNLFPMSDKVRENQINTNTDCMVELSDIKFEVHNIFLLILSLLFKVRGLEDYLENKSGTNEKNNLGIKDDISQQLTSLRDELANAVKCYDTIFHQGISKNKTVQRSELLAMTSEPKPRKTGIVVGTSDFNVNTPDDVFLAVSGLNLENCDNHISLDDWSLERKPQIPKTLLIELSDTLKSRKKEFNQREREALERKGLQDIEEKGSDSSDGECENVDRNYEMRAKLKQGNQNLETKEINSSDSDGDEQFKYKRRVASRRLRDFRNHLSGSMSESEISDTDGDLRYGSNLSNTLSLANLAALKSQQWRHSEEDCFSDG